MPRLAPVTTTTLFLNFIRLERRSPTRPVFDQPRTTRKFSADSFSVFRGLENTNTPGRRPAFRSPQVSRLHGVHVVEHLVFAGHAPDELVIARADAEVNRPVRRERHIFIMQKQMPCLLRFAEEMRNNFVAEVEVEINLRAPPMCVRRKRIPNI